jgi:hypothetical protein
MYKFIIPVAVFIFLMIFSINDAHCYSADFEANAQNFVAQRRPSFLPWLGYTLDITKEYGFTEIDTATVIGIMFNETMFGKTGVGRWNNFGGIRCGNSFCKYQNEFAGLEAIVSLYNRKYRSLTTKQVIVKWVGHYNRKYYHSVINIINNLRNGS